MTSTDEPAPSTGRSTWRVLGTLLIAIVAGLAGVGACVAAYVGSTPTRTLEVPRTELAVGVPKLYPLPSMGADASGTTLGVWVTLDADGAATAFLSRDPRTSCTVPWRPEFRFDNVTGVYRDPCGGSTYTRDGVRIFGPSPRGLDGYEVRVDPRRVVVDLSRVRLGTCGAESASEAADCSRPRAPVYRSQPPPPVRTPVGPGR